MTKRLLIFSLLSLFLLINVAYAGSPSTSGAIIMKQGISARALGMGEAFVAVADDINAINYNPAGLAYLKSSEINFCYLKGLVDTNWGVISFAMPFAGSTIGISCFTLQGGLLEVYDGSGRLTNTINAQSDYMAVFSYALKVKENFLLGFNVKGLSSTLGQSYNAAAYAFDAGFLYQMLKKLRLGFAVQNVGGEIKYIEVGDPLPLNIKAGFGWEFFTRKELDNITLAVDANYPNDSILRYNLGIEYQNIEMGAAIRMGYKFGEVLGCYTDGFSAGFRISDRMVHLDYAFILKGEMGFNQQISLAIDF